MLGDRETRNSEQDIKLESQTDIQTKRETREKETQSASHRLLQ